MSWIEEQFFLGAMSRALASALLTFLLLTLASASDNGYPRCTCDDDGSFWSIESLLECQRVSDFLIAVAYFSIPIELLYFVSCSNVPFKWVLFQFIAFIVLCGLTHLLNGWTYGPHPFQLMLALTVFKILTALVSCATAITLITLIPLLLKVKVREFMLKKKTWDLGREVGIIMKQKEAGLHVRMLTQEIRKSLDKHTILYTTMSELSETLGLHYCAVWMPNENKTEMNLTHELKGRNYSNGFSISIPIGGPDVVKIKRSDGVNILSPDSLLVTSSTGLLDEPGPVAGIRMPMLRFSNFKGGTPEVVRTDYAILVLVLPGGEPRSWSRQELEIIKVVADQVAVALSHAGLLEESQIMREKLAERNRALQQAKMSAMMASQATSCFQKVMSDGMRRPMHSIMGLLSILESELSDEQKMILDAMSRTSTVISTLINDVMDNSMKDSGKLLLDVRPFSLRSIVKEAACLARCLCVYKGFDFTIEVDRTLPDHVLGDERRVFQVIFHIVGSLLNGNQGGCLVFRVSLESGSHGRNDQRWATRRQSLREGGMHVRFEIGINPISNSQSEASFQAVAQAGRNYPSDGAEDRLSFSACKKLVQLMQGSIWVIPNPLGVAQSMSLVLPFQVGPSISVSISEPGGSSEHPHSNSIFRGLQVILADADNINRAVTRKLLEKLGCVVSTVSSGYECLTAITASGSSVQAVFLDLHMPDLDGFEVTMKIRNFRSINWVLIIGLTANSDLNVWEKCQRTGMNGVIRKPAQIQGISEELRRVLLQANRLM